MKKTIMAIAQRSRIGNVESWVSALQCLQLHMTCVALLIAATVHAADQEVSVAGLVSPTNKTLSLTVSTAKTDGAFPLPASDRPKFWFDCQQRTGWEVNGQGHVVKIPSLVGDRALTAKSSDLVTWQGWNSGNNPPQAPILVAEDATLGGLPTLDFGSLGSERALVFDAVGNPATNEYANIGTVIAVWGSQDGGGWLLGGGPGTATGDDSKSYAWMRGGSWSEAAATYTATYRYDSPVLGDDYSAAIAKNGVLRHDGMPTSPCNVGFNHAWEVVTLSPTAASLVATGLGVGDSRTSKRWYSGGMKVAELMIFERLLTPVEMSKVETWLQQKWFGRNVEGVDGCARVSRLFPRNGEEGATFIATVPDGETLSLGSLEGMRGRNSAFVKQGAGVLDVKDATGFAAPAKIEEGSVRFSGKRPIPALSDLSGLYLHFDATDLSSLVFETRSGNEYVSYWKDLAGGKIWTKRAFFKQTNESYQPRLLRNAVGTGLHMVDFGTLSAPGWMRVVKGDINSDGSIASSTDSSIGGVSTIIAVMGVQAGGGRIAILDIPACQRYTSNFSSSKYSAQMPILNGKIIDSSRGISATNGTAWVNGLKVDSEEGYGTPGYLVVALRVPGGEAKHLAAGLNSINGVDFGGGFRLGEMFVYNRILGDREIEDVSAYLMNRWFGREAPGYARTADRANLPEMQEVVASDGAGLDVAVDTTAHVASVASSGTVAKTGAGTLEVERLAADALKIAGGKVRTVAGHAVGISELAAAPCLHLDAADTTTFELVEDGGVSKVKRWYSKDRLNAAYLTKGSYLYRPSLNADKAVNGIPLVDFGAYGSGAYLVLEKALYSMRDVFVIIDGENGGGYLFSGRGSCNNETADECPNYQHSMPGEPMDFFPDVWTSPFALIAPSMSANVASGEILTNGVLVTASCKFPKTAALLEFHPQAAAGAYMIGCEKPWSNRGGFRLGEVVVYDRKLSARERVATRNYLMAKWFGRAPEELPDENVSSSIGALVGAGGIFEKADGGSLAVGEMSSFTGAVAVTSGSMTLMKSLPAVEPRLATEGRVVHFDASDLSSMTVVDKGTYTGVSEWRSQVNGWKAAAVSKYFPEGTTDLPRLMTSSLNGKSTLFLPETCGAMLFEDSDGLTNDVSGIRTTFWVIGTVNGATGGYVLGGGRMSTDGTGPRTYAWARSDAGRFDANASILAAICFDWIKWRCDWCMDGTPVSITSQAFGADAWHVLDMRLQSEYLNQVSLTASGFAFDGRLVDEADGWTKYRKYTGRQNLAEVIIYNRRLTDQEKAETLAYLQTKWGFCIESRECGVDLSVAAGALVDLNGRQRLRSVSGGGRIEGELDVESLVVDCSVTDASAVPEVQGELRLADGCAVRLSNLEAAGDGRLVPIARVQVVSGDLRDFTLVGDELPEGWRVRLRVAGGLLSADVGPRPGATIIVR